MKKITIIIAIISITLIVFATTMTVHTTSGNHEFEINQITSITFGTGSGSNILTDDFESYAINTFPSAGGWTIAYNGAGNQYQYITDQYSNSGSKSFRLQGQSSWGAQMINQLSQTPDVVYFEASFYSETVNDEGSFGLRNPDVGTWGTSIASVNFYDGTITCSGGYDLMDYIPQQWYKVKIRCDLNNGTISAWVNNELIISEEDVTYNTTPYTHASVAARNDGTNIVFFDDVQVWTED